MSKEEKQKAAFDLLLKHMNLKQKNPFSLRLLNADENKICLLDLEKASI